jgi:hypothetical protein
MKPLPLSRASIAAVLALPLLSIPLCVTPAHAANRGPSAVQTLAGYDQVFRIELLVPTGAGNSRLMRDMAGRWTLKGNNVCIGVKGLEERIDVKHIDVLPPELRKSTSTISARTLYRAARFDPPRASQPGDDQDYHADLAYGFASTLGRALGKVVQVGINTGGTGCAPDAHAVSSDRTQPQYHPRPVKGSWLDKLQSGDAAVIGQVSMADLRRARSERLAAIEHEQKADADREHALFSTPDAGLDAVYGILAVDTVRLRACYVASDDPLISTAARSFYRAQEIRDWVRAYPDGLHKMANLDEVLAEFSKASVYRKCNLFVGSGPTLGRLKEALERNRIPTVIHPMTFTGRKLLAGMGLRSLEELRFARSVGVKTSIQFEEMRKLGLDSPAGYEAAAGRHRRIGGDGKPDLDTLMAFVRDEREAAAQGKSVESFRAARAKQEEAQARTLAAAQREAEQKKAKAYPYVALVSCTFGPNGARLEACMSDSGLETELELRNGPDYKLYKMYEINQAGRWNGEAFEIDLRPSFSLKTQNASNSLVMNLVIKDRRNGKVVFQKSASRFGVLAAKN